MRSSVDIRTGYSRDDTGVSHPFRDSLPLLLTVDEAAAVLRTTRRAIYAMVARGQLPGVVRVRRRVLLRTDVLLHRLEQKCAPSPKE